MNQTHCACGTLKPGDSVKAGWKYDITADKFWCQTCNAWMKLDMASFQKWRAAAKEITDASA